MRSGLAVMIVVGCTPSAEPPGPPGPPAPRVAPPAAVGSAAPAVSAARPEDPAVRAAYRAGMRAGRAGTHARRWADALAGFDAALVAKPGDPRALGERGYARLVEGRDLAAATRDLDLAAGGTRQPTLLSEIWFNRGLVHEQRGERDNALAAFALAGALRPTAAAAAKLAGQVVCPVQVRRPAAPERPVVDAPDWLALARAVNVAAGEPPSTAAAALMLLTGEPTAPSLPAVVGAHARDEDVAYVVVRRGAGLRAIPVGAALRGRCPGSVEFVVEPGPGPLVLVRGAENVEGGSAFLCEGPGERVECTGAPDEISAGTACLGGSLTLRALVLDPMAGEVVMIAEQVDTGTRRVAIELVSTTLTLAGKGCDRRIPLAP